MTVALWRALDLTLSAADAEACGPVSLARNRARAAAGRGHGEQQEGGGGAAGGGVCRRDGSGHRVCFGSPRAADCSQGGRVSPRARGPHPEPRGSQEPADSRRGALRPLLLLLHSKLAHTLLSRHVQGTAQHGVLIDCLPLNASPSLPPLVSPVLASLILTPCRARGAPCSRHFSAMPPLWPASSTTSCPLISL